MMYVASKRGAKIIVPRNSHQSVWNACRIFGLEPVIVGGQIKEDVVLPPSPEEIERLIKYDKSICAIVAVSPDYYGNIAPLKQYSEIAKAYSRLLIVDGAHGAHLAFEPQKRGYAGVYADMWVDGAHKSLPVLTQGAVVSACDSGLAEELEEALTIFRTTSPSYPIMASVEYGIKYLKNNPAILEEAKNAVAQFKSTTSFKVHPADDWTKLVIDLKPNGVSADKVAAGLEKKGIYAELSDGRYILFYLSPMVNKAVLSKLSAQLTSVIFAKGVKGSYCDRPAYPGFDRTYSFGYAYRNDKEYVDLKSAEGRMSACNAGFAPPCIPVIVAGEIISKEAIEALSGRSGTYGIKNGKIAVVKR